MRWGTTVKHWSVTNLPSDNLLRADFCLGELDTCFTCNSHVVNSINREGLPLQQAKIFRHILLFHWHKTRNCTHVLYKSFKGVCFIWREKQIKTWCEGDGANIFVCTLSHWLQMEYGSRNYSSRCHSCQYWMKNESGKTFISSWF